MSITSLHRNESMRAAGAAATHVTRRRGRTVRRAVLGALAVLALVALVLAWRPRPVHVEVADVGRGDLVVTVNELAKTRVRDRYVVSAPIGGDVMRIELRPGDPVDAGSVLARIVPMQAPLLDPRTRAESQSRAAGAGAAVRQAQAAVARAEVAARHAEDELGRTRRLVESGSLPRDALTRAELDARVTAEELTSARFAAQMNAHEAAMANAALRRFESRGAEDHFDVTSPVQGIVLRVPQQSAGVVQPGAALVEIGDPAGLEIVADVLTADAVRMQPGASVTVERWGGPPLPAHVRRVEPSAFTRISALGVEEQRVSVLVDLDAPRAQWASLGDGFRVEVSIVLAERKGVLRVPLGAAFRHEGQWATYVIRAGVARLVDVGLGARSDTDVEITSGLAEHERVVVHPSERVADGVRVDVP